jgi:hypothetical protein
MLNVLTSGSSSPSWSKLKHPTTPDGEGPARCHGVSPAAVEDGSAPAATDAGEAHAEGTPLPPASSLCCPPVVLKSR